MPGKDLLDDTWLRPIDLMADSDAPDEIALELGHRHAHYLREARRLVLDGESPDADGLAEGIRAETRRYLRSHPWHAHPTLEPAVAAAEDRTLGLLREIAATVPAKRIKSAPPPRPVRRLALQPSATIVGSLTVRKRPTERGVELSWDPASGVVEWTIRVSARPDPRSDYAELEQVTLPGAATSYEVELDDVPRRIQLAGRARGNRTVQRATVSALTRGNSGSQWKRQASAS